MAAPLYRWYDSTGTDLVTSLTFTGIIPGAATDAQELWLYNGKGEGDRDAGRGLRLLVSARIPGGPAFLAAGEPYLDERWIEARVVGAVGEARVALTAWIALGSGAALPLLDLPTDSAHKVEWRVNAPASANIAAVEVRIDVVDHPAIPAGYGLSDACPDGVLMGIGDGSFTALVVGGDVTESDTPADTIEVPYLAGIFAGIPLGVAAHQEALDDEDSAAAALVSGEAYRAYVTLAATGVEIVKGVKASSGSAELPALPAGYEPIADVLREFDGIINASDITQLRTAGRYAAVTSGLIVTLGPGACVVENAAIRHTFPTSITLTASSTNRVWMTRTGSLAKTTTAAPPTGNPRALLLYEFDADGSGVTATRDRRLFIGPRLRKMRFRWGGELMAGDGSGAEGADSRDLYLDPERTAIAVLDDQGTGTTDDETRFDIKISEAGAAWESIFGDADDMLRIAHDAADPTTRTCRPVTLVIPAGSRVQWFVDDIPTGGNAPPGATGILDAWER
jgi:hypothetical protein